MCALVGADFQFGLFFADMGAGVHIADPASILQGYIPDPAGRQGSRHGVGAHKTGVMDVIRYWHYQSAVAQQPLRVVDPFYAKFFLDQNGGEARAIDK